MSQPRVFIAVPQYRLMPLEKELELAEAFGFKDWRPLGFHPKFILSLGKTKKYINGELNVLRGDSMIERARSSLFGQWLARWNAGDRFEYFMQIDEDIEFPEDAISKLIESGKPFIGAAYSYRAKLGHKVGRSVCKYLPNEIPDERGVLKIRWLSGGFVLCHYLLLLELMSRYPELQYDRLATESDEDKMKESYIFWLPLVHRIEDGPFSGKKIFLSEDYAFAQRVNDAGFANHEDTTIKLTHWDGLNSYMVGAQQSEAHHDGIPGWMNPTELAWLSEQAKQMDSIVEIGSWKGRSTKVLLENCPGTVYAVDSFMGTPNCTDELAMTSGGEGTYDEFMKNVGHFKNLKVMRMKSLEAAEAMNGKKFDLVFIDGDHSFNAVFDDIRNWLPKTKKLICGHDYTEVAYPVHQLLGKVEVCGSIWFKYL